MTSEGKRILICPTPFAWLRVHEQLMRASRKRPDIRERPPKPLFMDAWMYASDIQKHRRWQETLKWIERHGMQEHLLNLPDDDWYYGELENTG